MIAAVIAWLLQDWLQVLVMGFMLVPDLFLLVAVYKIVSGPLDQVSLSWWVWFAFLGGIIWDLRWSSSPGMSGLINTAAVGFVYWLWHRTPLGGRSAVLLAALAGGIHFVSGIVHYFAWAVPSREATQMFAVQQLMGIPVLIGICMIYAFRATETHV